MNGQQLKEAGLQLAESSAGSWVDDMLAALATFCIVRKDHGLPLFRFEEFRQAAIKAGHSEPKSHKAWGCLPRLAVKRGLIAWTGKHVPAHSAKTHGHYIKVWQAL